MSASPSETNVELRPITVTDIDFLWRMLGRAAHVPVDELGTFRSDPEVARLLSDWSRPGDRGIIAEIAGAEAGAAWLRDPVPSDEGLVTSVSSEHPELVISVVDGHEGSGLGSTLMAALLDLADADGTPAIVLSVRTYNPAVALYERHGFMITNEITNRVGSRSYVMKRTLPDHG